MRVTVTLKVKLETTEHVSQSIAEAQKAYAMALNHTSDVAFEKKVWLFRNCRNYHNIL